MKRMLFPLAAALAISSAAAIDAPDFAFPVTVIDSARTVLASPSATPLGRMQATMQIVNAEIEIDRNRAFTLPHFIDSVAAEINDPAVRGLMTLYQASLVSRIYMDNSYKYRKIDAPLYPFPADMSLWSAKQFAVCVDSLVTEGLRLSASAGNTPLSDYSQIISVPAESAMWYPRLRDFTYSQAMNYYNAVDRHSQAEALSADIFRATSPGSPEWAVWAGKQPQDTILSCIRRYSDGDVGAYLLLRYASEIRNDDPNKSMIVRMMRDFIKRNSNSPFVGQVKTLIVLRSLRLRSALTIHCVPANRRCCMLKAITFLLPASLSGLTMTICPSGLIRKMISRFPALSEPITIPVTSLTVLKSFSPPAHICFMAL